MATSLLSVPLIVLPLMLGAGPVERQPSPPAATPSSAPHADAWAVWTSWPRGTISNEALELVRMLDPGRELSPEELRKGSEAREQLERATEHLRRGLSQSTCVAPGTADVLTVMKLGDAVALRALLLGVQGSGSTPLLTDLLAAGRRAARCQGSLLSFKIGQTIERRAFIVLWWLAERRLLSADEARALGESLARDMLSHRDLAKALTHEEQQVRKLLPASPDIAHTWSRAETEALLARHLTVLRAALEKETLDTQPVRAATSGLIDKDDEQFLSPLLERQPGDLLALLGEVSQATLPKRPNVAGRFLVKRILESTLRVVDEVSSELQRQRGEIAVVRAGLDHLVVGKRGPRSKPPADPYGGTLIVEAQGVRSRGPDRIDGSDDDLRFTLRDKPRPPAVETPAKAVVTPAKALGSCKQTAPGRYVLDEQAMHHLETKGEGAAVMQARIVPAFEQERSIGFKIFAIKAGSLPATCGFQDGDILTQLNEQPLTEPASALAAIELVKKARRASFRIRRQGEWVDLVVEPPAR
jgi:hypothetical protein